ncbi:MAG: TonB-dependent receptor [Bacteroidales bacterium]|nr:TonB-dependent receptor [Bacteroidales bacterium]
MKKLHQQFHNMIALAMAIFMSTSVVAQEMTHLHLDEVVSTAHRHPNPSKADSIFLASTNQEDISTALRLMPSVIIKDYGGLGGIKTINIRSLGASHTNISIDGVPMANMQTGTIDLGSFATPSISSLEAQSAEPIGLLSTPKARALGANVSINTPSPDADSLSLHALLSTGSLNHRVNSTILFPLFKSNVHARLYLGYDFSNGKYRYKLHYGNASTDSTSTETRQNGQVWRIPAELDLSFNTGIVSHRTKINLMYTDRGLPRATTFYSLNSNESLTDNNIFLQHVATVRFGRSRLRISSRYTRQHEVYRNPDALGSDAYRRSSYLQHNSYLALASEYFPSDNLALALSADLEYGSLYANTVEGTPTRLSTGISIASRYTGKFFNLNGELTAIRHRENADAHSNNASDSPTSLCESLGADFYLGYFIFNIQGKNSSRLPSFNDLYYNGIGNRNLKTEKASQFSTSLSILLKWLSVSANYYHNIVRDKIIAMPTKNIFYWSMLNVGKVDIQGFDLSLRLDKSFARDWSIMAFATYTRQYALDVTSRNNGTYRHQIAYTPRKQGSITSTLNTPVLDISYSLIYQGKRYALNQNIADNAIKKFCDERLSFRCAHRVLHGISQYLSDVQFEVSNISNSNYQIVRNYPMPGRQYNILMSFQI